MIRAANLNKSFGGVRAVQDVSISVPENSIFALIGPNGAGKSTLLNLLSGIYQPDAGSLHLGATNLVGMVAHQRARLGIARTFQKIRLFKQLTLLENVARRIPYPPGTCRCGSFFHGASGRFRPKRRSSSLRRTRRARGRARRSLPYGQQRMLEIARALATRPRLFMLDEPAAGLNTAEMEFLLQRLEEICRRGVTLIVVEQTWTLVMNVAQRVFVMHHGCAALRRHAERGAGNPSVIEAYLGGELLLEVESLELAYGDVPAVRRGPFQVAEGGS